MLFWFALRFRKDRPSQRLKACWVKMESGLFNEVAEIMISSHTAEAPLLNFLLWGHGTCSGNREISASCLAPTSTWSCLDWVSHTLPHCQNEKGNKFCSHRGTQGQTAETESGRCELNEAASGCQLLLVLQLVFPWGWGGGAATVHVLLNGGIIWR